MSNDRVGRLAAQLVQDGMDALFLSSSISMSYLKGFGEAGGERFSVLGVNPKGEVALICPALSETQARRSGIPDVRSWKDGEDPVALFAQLAAEWGLRSAVIAVEDEMPASFLLMMQGALPAALFRPGLSLLAPLMGVKDECELALMRQAGGIADEAFVEVKGKIRPGMSEHEVDGLLRDAMKARGGAPAFCIVAAGANAAEPHHESDETIIQPGDVIILDFGCTVKGYLSDITRTVACGGASPRAKELYDLVYRAHMAGRHAAKPGNSGQDVDRAARHVIQEAGFGEFFFHRTGHGIGMRGHEAPFMIEGNTQPLVPGNCFSVEPGVYLSGEIGIRIENIVTVTANGHQSLNAEPSPILEELG